jgi:hypothetical protein
VSAREEEGRGGTRTLDTAVERPEGLGFTSQRQQQSATPGGVRERERESERERELD